MPDSVITPREQAILGLLARGFTYREIMKEFHLSRNTVKKHASNLYANLGALNSAHAVALGIAHNVLPLEHRHAQMQPLDAVITYQTSRGLTHNQIARIVGKSPETVRGRRRILCIRLGIPGSAPALVYTASCARLIPLLQVP